MLINFRTIKSLLFNLALFHILAVIGLRIIFALISNFITDIGKEMITTNTLF